MRYCRNCHNWNIGEPRRCRFCGSGLEGRLCPSGHVNPPSRSLGFCGECGKPLERTWGAGFSIKPYLLAGGVIMATVILSAAVVTIGQIDAPVVTALVVLIITVVGFRLAFQVLPPWIAKFLGEVVTFFARVILGTRK